MFLMVSERFERSIISTYYSIFQIWCIRPALPTNFLFIFHSPALLVHIFISIPRRRRIYYFYSLIFHSPAKLVHIFIFIPFTSEAGSYLCLYYGYIRRLSGANPPFILFIYFIYSNPQGGFLLYVYIFIPRRKAYKWGGGTMYNRKLYTFK